MSTETVTCLFCQTENKTTDASCNNCGMPISKAPPESSAQKRNFFKKWFWCVVVFCVLMMFYLPR